MMAFLFIAAVIAALFFVACLFDKSGPLVTRILDAILPEAKHESDATKVAEARDLHTARTLAFIGICGNEHGALTCDRAEGHEGLHADRHTKRNGNPIAWVNFGSDGAA